MDEFKKFAVLISVYSKDNACFFNDALVSVYDDQTCKPSQIVLVCDGKVGDDIESVILEWEDKLKETLTLVRINENVGLAKALNEGLKYCKYELVARMDSDDLSLPHRFEKQLAFMAANPGIAASSSWIEEFGSDGLSTGIRTLPLEFGELQKFARWRSPLSHPAVIFRKSVILGVGGYPNFRNAQDYALWSLLIVNRKKIANLPETLVRMRAGQAMVVRRGVSFFKQEVQLLKFQYEIGFLGQMGFIVRVLARGAVRLSPPFIRRLLYRLVRK